MASQKLKRTLGLTDLIFFGIGGIIGTGIFVIPAIAAKMVGVASLWIWLELGCMTIFMALCVAELASIHPDPGGPYKFVKEAFGSYFGFLSGWTAWLVSWMTIASLAVAVGYYATYFFPLSRLGTIFVAIWVLCGITFMNYKGMRWGLKAQYILTAISILVLWMFVTWGVYFIKIENFIPSRVVQFPAMMAAAVFIIEPFIGWETLTYFAEDSKRPHIDIPKAIFYSSVIVTLLYSAVLFVTLGLLHAASLEGSRFPLASAAEVFVGQAGGAVVAVGAIAVLLGCLNCWVVSSARLPLAMARDGLFPKSLRHIHKEHGTPHKALVVQLLFSIAAVSVAGFEQIVYVLVSLALIFYVMMFLSIPVHRAKVRKIPFKLPFGVLVPAIAIGVALAVVIQIPVNYLLFSLFLMFSGTFLYLYMQVMTK